MPNNTQPDYIAPAMVAAMIIIVVIMVIRKWRSDHKAVSSETQVQEVAAPAVQPETYVIRCGGAVWYLFHPVHRRYLLPRN